MKNLNTLREISSKIVEHLKSDDNILAFKYENQFQFNSIAIYILGEMDKLENINSRIKNAFNFYVKDDKVILNILYNFVDQDKLYDHEFLSGKDDFIKGYSFHQFGSLSCLSDLENDFYVK